MSALFSSTSTRRSTLSYPLRSNFTSAPRLKAIREIIDQGLAETKAHGQGRSHNLGGSCGWVMAWTNRGNKRIRLPDILFFVDTGAIHRRKNWKIFLR